jgi:hypothetical protein
MSIELDANALYYKLTEAGNEWAELQAAYNVLDDTKNTVLAKLTLSSSASSVAAREVEARASEQFIEHVKATQKAFADSLKAKVKYDSMKIWIDLQRTAAANERALTKL